MEELVKGSIEYLPVVVADRLDNLTTLDGLTVEFMIGDEPNSTTPVVDWTSCTTDVMTALPLIDTTTFDLVIYKLFIRITISPEVPILGPFEFAVI